MAPAAQLLVRTPTVVARTYGTRKAQHSISIGIGNTASAPATHLDSIDDVLNQPCVTPAVLLVCRHGDVGVAGGRHGAHAATSLHCPLEGLGLELCVHQQRLQG
jgi:hypothetical protein